MTADEETIAYVAIEATALFAEGIADQLNDSAQPILDHPLPTGEYKQGYKDAVEDLQKLLRSLASQQREKNVVIPED